MCSVPQQDRSRTGAIVRSIAFYSVLFLVSNTPAQAQVTITNSSSLPAATVTGAYTQTFTATGGTAPYTWSNPASAFGCTGGPIPSGLGLSSTGDLTGNLGASGTYTFCVQATDSDPVTPLSTAKLFSLTVNPAPSITTATIPNWTVNRLYAQTLTATGGTGSLGWSVPPGTLPLGLTLSGSGAITGTPTTAGSYGFTVSVTDSNGVSGSKIYSVVINAAPAISTASLPDGEVSVAYSQALSATNGTSPLTFTLASGALPTGLTLASSGAISGTPTQAGLYNFTAQVTDAAGATATKALSINVATGPVITTASLPNWTATRPYSQTLAASGGTGSFTWSLNSGNLPTGLTISTGGAITGTPTTAGSYGFTVKATDTAGAFATKAYTVVINAVPVISTTSLPDGEISISYSQALSATNGTSPLTFSLASGALPTGLTLASSGAISGTPTQAGLYNFTALVTDAVGATANRTLSINVIAGVSITTTSLPGGTVGQAYPSTVLSGTGGTTPYTWSVTSGSLAPGLALNTSTGLIGGTATAAGNFSFTVQVADARGATATQGLAINIAGALSIFTSPNLPSGKVDQPYLVGLQARGGTAPYVWSVTSGSLPPGLNLSSTGVITGTPTTAGAFDFGVLVTDARNATASASMTITIQPPLVIQSPANLPDGTMGITYLTTLSATGGVIPYTWSISVGSPPPGLSLGSNGTLAGTPTANGTFTFTAQVYDSTGSMVSQNFTVKINSNLSIATDVSLPNGVTGSLYTQVFTASGGIVPYRWSVLAGSLPPGLSFSGSTLGGTPTAVGTYHFTIQVTDSSGVNIAKAFTLIVASGLTITTAPLLPDARTGAPYSLALLAAGGAAPLQWSLTSGTLPVGLALSNSGMLSGTSPTPGTSTFTIQVTDQLGAKASETFTLRVISEQLTILTTSLPSGTEGVSYSQILTAGGGFGSYVWSVNSGVLPTGLTLSGGGTLSGVPTAAGTSTFTVQVQDESENKAVTILELTIDANAMRIVTPPQLPQHEGGTAVSETLTADGGIPPYTWTVAGGSLPPGLSLNPNGTISGVATGGGDFAFTAQVTDSTGVKRQQTFQISITAPGGVPSATASGLGDTIVAGSQPIVHFELSKAYPISITVLATLDLQPSAGSNPGSTDLRFAQSGSREATLTIPANATSMDVPFQSGTLAGTVTFRAKLQVGDQNLQVSPDSLVTHIQPAPPTISRVQLVRTATGFNVVVVGYSPSRDMSKATFRFNPVSGGNLQTIELTVDVTTLFTTWYGDPASGSLGSQFEYTQPFNVQGDVNQIASVTMALTNSQGASQSSTATF